MNQEPSRIDETVRISINAAADPNLTPTEQAQILSKLIGGIAAAEPRNDSNLPELLLALQRIGQDFYRRRPEITA